MNELSPEAESLVEAGRRADLPSEHDKARVRRRLVTELGAGAFAALSAAAAPAEVARQAGLLQGVGRRRLGLASRPLRWLAAAASGAAVYLGITLLPAAQREPSRASRPEACCREASTTPEPMPEPAIEQAPAGLDAPEPLTPATSERAPEVSAPAPAARKRAAAPSRARDKDTLGAELALLSAAQRALRAHDPQAALRLAQEHATRFAHGALEEERASVTALAYCQLGQPEQAAVQTFLAQAAHSPLAARVRRECKLP